MTASLSLLIPFKLQVDDREPFFLIHREWLGFIEDDYGVYPLSIIYWIETLTAVALQGVVAAIVSIVAYKLIIQKQGSHLSFVVGFGVLLPFWVFMPQYQIQLLDVRNAMMRFCVGVICPTLGIFHTTEAMYGFAPAYATQSLGTYALYWASPIPLTQVEDEKGGYRAKKANMLDFFRHLKRFALALIVASAFQSILTPGKFRFYPVEDLPWYSLERLLDPNQQRNNMMHAILMEIYLVLYVEGLTAATVLLLWRKCDAVMHNPLLMSASPSDFWTRRWNTLVQGVLKRGVYKPMRSRGCSRGAAIAGTFLASGLFHEWLLTTCFMTFDESGRFGSYVPLFGGATAFMMWNALIIMVEAIWGQEKIFQQIQQGVPKPIVSLAIVSLGVMVAHFFMDPYILSNAFFQQGGIGLLLVLPMKR